MKIGKPCLRCDFYWRLSHIYVCTLHKWALQLCKLDLHCLTESLSLCLLTRFHANSGGLPVDSYFMHHQCLQRWRPVSMNLQTIRVLNSWPLCTVLANSWVGKGACACYGKSGLSGSRPPPKRKAAKLRTLFQSALHGCRTLAHAAHILYTHVPIGHLCTSFFYIRGLQTAFYILGLQTACHPMSSYSFLA